MKAVILAGGKGTRLRPVTLEIPKPLITVRKKPIVNYLIELFLQHGVKDVALIIHKDHGEDYDWWRVRYAKELQGANIEIMKEMEEAGTFGALRPIKDWVGGESFIVTNGDELKEFNLKLMMAHHAKHRPLGTIGLVQVENPQHYGVPVMEGNLVREFLEKPENPPSNYINSGIYILSHKVFGYDDPKTVFLMTEKHLFPRLAKQGKLSGYKIKNGRWFDCGTLERWEAAINNL